MTSIFNLLPVGEENAVSLKALSAQTGLPERALRAQGRLNLNRWKMIPKIHEKPNRRTHTMCYEEVLKEYRKEARRNGLKLVPERIVGLYSVADKATNQVVSPRPMNPYSIQEWMTEYTAQA